MSSSTNPNETLDEIQKWVEEKNYRIIGNIKLYKNLFSR